MFEERWGNKHETITMVSLLFINLVIHFHRLILRIFMSSQHSISLSIIFLPNNHECFGMLNIWHTDTHILSIFISVKWSHCLPHCFFLLLFLLLTVPSSFFLFGLLLLLAVVYVWKTIPNVITVSSKIILKYRIHNNCSGFPLHNKTSCVITETFILKTEWNKYRKFFY